MATTVSHDCHNLTLCYKTTQDGFAAAQALIGCGGGFCTVRRGTVTGLLKLPVAGLMSILSCRELVPAISAQEQATDEIFTRPGYMMKLSLVSLACTQNAVITDKGLFDGRTQKFYQQFIQE